MGHQTAGALREREERCGRDMGGEGMTGCQRRGKSCRRGYQAMLIMESNVGSMNCTRTLRRQHESSHLPALTHSDGVGAPGRDSGGHTHNAIPGGTAASVWVGGACDGAALSPSRHRDAASSWPSDSAAPVSLIAGCNADCRVGYRIGCLSTATATTTGG